MKGRPQEAGPAEQGSIFRLVSEQCSREVRFFVGWVERFQREVRPFNDQVFALMQRKIGELFHKEAEVG